MKYNEILSEAKRYTVIKAPKLSSPWWANEGIYKLFNGKILKITVGKTSEYLEVKAFIDNEPVGFVDFDITEIEGEHDKETDEWNDDIVIATASHVHVNEPFRRLGIATIMYDHVERTGITIKKSGDLWKDGKSFWKARKPFNKK